MKTQVILAAAGQGTRLKSREAKPFVLLKGRPLVTYSLSVFESCPLVHSVIVVGNERDLSGMRRVIGDGAFGKVARIVAGGPRRTDSVRNGLAALDEDTGIVLVHDAARPLVSGALVEELITACGSESAVIAAVPVNPTIKRVDPERLYVEATLDRSFLWEVQTPQAFRAEVIRRAHRDHADPGATDDAFLVEKMGEAVKVVMGRYDNIKITTGDDLAIAENFLNRTQV